ncbi:MAG: hypothetical protein HYV24_12635 [Deltaproteobacteria bacterium]|nr:hypothetical protein [Deltaproteobacteria bacterium]
MVRVSGHIHKEETSGERALFVLTVLLLAAVLVLPMWGLFVILLDFTIVFLPVLAAFALAVLIARGLRRRSRHV